MAVLIDGNYTSEVIRQEMSAQVAAMESKPGLAVILVGEDPASKIYVKRKNKACRDIGISSTVIRMEESTTQETLIEKINELNADDSINGILVQLPLPKHIDEHAVIKAIDVNKDVDCFCEENVGKLFIGENGFRPCTPAGIIELLKRYNIEIKGKNCVVIGRSNIVGKPVSAMLMAENGTVTVCHSRTADLKFYTKNADILVAAVGKPNFVTEDMVKEGAVVIDVGINRLDNGKLCGDVDFENVEKHASFITPVPGGVGPMTITMLLKNTIQAKLMADNK